MSVLARYLEAEGIATTLISLVKEHSNAIQPPRTLWVPFELGRPLGAPNNPAFQTDVLRAALALLERSGPGPISVDYTQEAPESNANPAWQTPVDCSVYQNAWQVAESLEARRAALHAEIDALAAAHSAFKEINNKSITGLIQLDSHAQIDWLTGYEVGSNPESPIPGMSGLLLTRFCADDLKSYYLEAGASGSEHPSSKQLTDWLWDETALGAQLRALRRLAIDTGTDREKTVLGRFLVSGARGYVDDKALGLV